MSRHAVHRCHTRHIPVDAVEVALEYGLCRRTRGAEIYILGWREVRFWAERGLDLSRFEGVEVICAHDGRVITVYRNRKPCSTRDRAQRRVA